MGGLSAAKREARIAKLSRLIADVEDSRPRSEMQLAQIDFDIQRFVRTKGRPLSHR